MKARVLLLATFATKEEELAYFEERLRFHGVKTKALDISLLSQGQVLSGQGKLDAMKGAVEKAIEELAKAMEEPVHA
ncbi:MAG: hypothetical protein AAF618_06795, partial [Pseudomonadota bacterium]